MNKILRQLTSYILIVIGALLASFSVACILLPNDAIDYGTAGIAILISKLSGWDLSFCVFALMTPFIIGGCYHIGHQFMIKSLLGTLAYTGGLAVFEHFEVTLNVEHFIAVAFGGAILGAGLSLILRNGGCIDGSEMLANIIIKTISDRTGKNYSMTYILITFNIFVYLAVFILINPNSALISLLVYIIATAVIDHFTDHFEAIKQVTIITKTPDELIKNIKDELNKTCTIMNSKGAIAGDNKTLICYVTYFELQKLRDIISRNKGTFCTVSTVDEILR